LIEIGNLLFQIVIHHISLMMEALVKYIKAFKRLRMDRSHGQSAPHKPILLLSVLQTFQNGVSVNNRVEISPELVALFKTNWSLLVRSKHDCRISYPFYYMKSEGFWKLVPKEGYINIDQLGSAIKSFSKLSNSVECAIISDDLTALMLDSETNHLLQQYLLDEYFTSSKENLLDSIDIQQNLFTAIESKLLNEPAAEYRKEIEALIEEKNEEEIFLRGSLFKREIPKLYNNTCCISGMSVDATISVSMIDACHIVPFSESYDDTVTNGIALCPNLHRAFDRHLITIDGNYKVIVSPRFKEEISQYTIGNFEGVRILLPELKRYHPNLENLSLHRERFNLKNF
jgi:putative restriction endonuclease